jgi:hypothetical protein
MMEMEKENELLLEEISFLSLSSPSSILFSSFYTLSSLLCFNPSFLIFHRWWKRNNHHRSRNEGNGKRKRTFTGRDGKRLRSVRTLSRCRTLLPSHLLLLSDPSDDPSSHLSPSSLIDVIDLSMRNPWVSIDFSPFQLAENTPIRKVLFMFSMLGGHILFVTYRGKLVGSITKQSLVLRLSPPPMQ